MENQKLFWLVVALHIASFSATSNACLCIDGTPCLEVYCSINKEADIHRTQEMFRNKTAKDLKMVALEFACSSVLPANLLGDIRTREIHLYGSGNQPFLVNLLSPDVFRSSEAFTEELFIYDSDLTGTDWTFVKNFTKMKNIFIRRSFLNNLNSIPHLPALESLHLDTPLKLEDLMWPTMNVTNLTSITITNAIDLDKNEINNFVNNFPQNLLHVQLSSLNLTQVPSKIRRLNKLKTLDLSTNSIHHIAATSLPTFSQIEFIDFRSNELKSIDKDALRGNLTSTNIDLSHNDISSLDYSVFFPVLNSMVNGTGFIYLYKNPLRCDCDIAWLIRDNRHLLDFVWNAFCSNGTSFSNLNPHDFNDCPLEKSL